MATRFCSALALVATLAGVGSAQTVTYNAQATTGSIGTFFDTTPYSLQVMNLNVPNGQPTQFNQATIALYWASGASTTNVVAVSFYSNVDTSSTTTDALGTATFLGGAAFTLTNPASIPGGYIYNLPLTASNIQTTSNTIGFEIGVFSDTTFTTPSADLRLVYTTGSPTVGTNGGAVYFDDDQNGFYTNTELQTFGAPTNQYLALTTTPVPEPTVAMALGIAAGAVFFRRRKAA